MNNYLNQKSFNTRLLIIPFLILMVLSFSFTIFIDYSISQVKSYCKNLMLEIFKGDFSILEKENGNIAILACSVISEPTEWLQKESNK